MASKSGAKNGYQAGDNWEQVFTPPVQRKRRKFWLNVLPEDLWLNVKKGVTIHDALRETNVVLESDCGGFGKCGQCKVRILSSIGWPSDSEERFLDEDEITQGIRLACYTKIEDDMVIHTGEAHPGLEYHQILKTGHRPFFPSEQLDPLIDLKAVNLSSENHEDATSDLSRIRSSLSSGSTDLKASLNCLRTFPQLSGKSHAVGMAVIHDNCIIGFQDQGKAATGYGLAFDLGTSTLVGKLINLSDGSEIAVISRLNSQRRCGTNVLSRLHFVAEHTNGLDYLHDLLIEDINRIIKRLLKVAELEPDDIFIAVAAGNTAMQHLFLNLSPHGIAKAPFSPVLAEGIVVRALDAGLKLNPGALVYTMPVKSGYIGGDLLSVILASGAADQEDEIVLGMDFGTNAEIFLGNRKRMLTCSAAAGPALEGAKISHGMIAKAGAIESVYIEKGDIHYRDVGNIKPKGLCGSGLVDLVAVLLHLGVIDEEGLIVFPKMEIGAGLRSRIINHSDVRRFLVASAEESYNGKPIYLTQRDVREVQLAIGAIGAGVQTLIDEMGIGVEDIGRVYLAGALGNYIDPLSAMRVGLLPKTDPRIVISLGNAASTGASMVLLSKEYWRKINGLADFLEHVELSSHSDFNEYFIEHMDFSTENLW